MKQIYKQHIGFNESAYKEGVRVYKDALITIDYQIVTNLDMLMVYVK
jgi:hypothetical protein